MWTPLCGDDGCGGLCGACDDAHLCTVDECVEGTCHHIVGAYFCLVDGDCVPTGALNMDNICQECVPAAAQEEWSNVLEGTACEGGACVCTVDCGDKECGNDGCGSPCGLHGGSCEDEDECTDDYCDPATLMCVYEKFDC